MTLDFALARLAAVIDKLVVYPDSMKKNSGPPRRAGPFAARAFGADAKRRRARGRLSAGAAQRHAGVGGEGDFLTFLNADPDVRKYLSDKELAANFDLDFHFAHVNTIFKRVFGRA